MKAIEESGYIPSAVARSLSVQNSHNIGVIFPDIENPFFSSALGGITQVAEKSDYNVFFFNTDESAKKEHVFLNMVQRQRLDGIILSPANGFDVETRETLEKFDKQGVPVVLLDRKLYGGNFSIVEAEDRIGAYMAVKQFVLEGHRRIAMIQGLSTHSPIMERAAGFYQAMEEFHIPLPDGYVMGTDQKSELAYEATKVLMNLPEPPTAIFTCNNMMTLGCLKYLTEHGIVIGKDVSLIGFDDIDILKVIDYHLSVVDRSARDMGKIAMELLLEHLEQPECENRSVTVPSSLILRGTEKCSPESLK